MKLNNRRPKVVIVDDHEANLTALDVILSSVACELIRCSSGEEALHTLNESEAALVLLDVQMPAMDGFETAAAIRKTKFGAQTPILFVTASDPDSKQVLKAYQMGAVDVVFKPIIAEVLCAKVEFFLEMFLKTKELEEKTELLNQSAEAEKTSLLENALDAVVGVDENNRVIFWNKNAETIFGWTKDEILGRDMVDTIVPENLRAGHRAGMKRFIDTGISKIQNRRIEIPGLRRDGEIFPMELTVSSVKSNSGFKFYSFMRDITELAVERKKLKESARQLKLESHKLETIFQETPAAMALWRGPDFIFEKVNPQYQAIFPDRELIGLPFLEACPEFKDAPFFGYLKRVLETGEPFIGKEEYAPLRPKKDGPLEDRYYDFTYLRINDVEGKPYGVYDHAIDVTEKVTSRKEIEKAKQLADEARNEAEKANELKSAFLANMSHEIRTPLGAMIGFADLLRDQSLTNTERTSYIDILARNGESLSVIINDILDLSKVEAGHLTLEYTDMFPDKIGSDIISLLRVKAKEKNLILEYDFDENTPSSIVSDPTRCRQILLNIVGNAIKFTQFGSVKVRSFGGKTESGKNAVCFEVSDTGIGIAHSEIDRVFEVFVQGDGTMTRRFGGTGLGLSLSRSLARAMGGDVSISKTEEGVGTTFLIKIEDQVEKKSANIATSEFKDREPYETKEQALKGVKILVIDDAPDNQQLIWRYLTKQGAIVQSAENGLVGYQSALSGNFDVILMDIQMPVMDGYTATYKLRSAGYRKPIIALTAHAMNEIRQRCLSVGCTAYLTKPINSRELIATIEEYAKR